MRIHYVRTEPLDLLSVNGESLLLLPPDQVVRLSPIATAIFELASIPRSLEDLTSAVENRFGHPPAATTKSALSTVIDSLVEAGALRQVDDA